VLREALESLDKDRSFDLRHADETFRSLDRLVGQSAAFLVAGHTHLERALKRSAGPGYYFNTGTWARLIAIDHHRRSDAAQFHAMIHAFEAGTMAALEAIPGLIHQDNPVASFTSSNGAVEASLMHTTPKGSGYELLAVDGGTFTLGSI
jgi:hypothetical protein